MLDIVNEQEVSDILNIKKVDKGTVENKDISFNDYIVVNELPSGFKGYPEGTVISYKPLTLGELESLNSGDSVDTFRGIAMLMNSIHCNTMNVKDLYYWDVMYIGIRRKLLAFGDIKGIIYEQCPKCGNIVQKEFSYTELDFKDLEAPALPVITTINGVDVEFGLLTIQEFLEVDIEKGELDPYARMIKNLPYEQAYELLSKCTGKDAKKIKYIDKKLTYGLKPLIQQCSNTIPNPEYNKKDKTSKKEIICGHNVRMEVTSPFEVVFPENLDYDDIEAEIQFGK